MSDTIMIGKAAHENVQAVLKILGPAYGFGASEDSQCTYRGVFYFEHNGKRHHVGCKPSELKEIKPHALADKVRAVLNRLAGV